MDAEFVAEMVVALSAIAAAGLEIGLALFKRLVAKLGGVSFDHGR